MINQLFLSLGGNLGNTREIFEGAYPLIEKKIGKISVYSSIYQTEAWGPIPQADFLNQVHKLGMPMVGIDPALVLCSRDEYKEILGANRGAFEVKLANEWLLGILQDIPTKAMQDKQFTWFSHCTESTAKPNTANEWSKIFTHFGAKLTAVNLGCCGMAGSFGYEKEHYDVSMKIGELVILDKGERHRLLGKDNWGVVAEIWMHTDPQNPSDEEDIVRLQDDYARK